MNLFKVKKYTHTAVKQWNTFVANSQNGTFLFHRDFMEYHSDRFEDVSLMVFDGDKLVALFPANIKDDEVFSHQGLSYGGILVQKNTRIELIKRIFDSIILFYKNNKIVKLYYKDIPSIYCQKFNDDLKYLLWNNGAQLYRVDTLNVVDLQQTLLLRGGRKDGIKRGQKNNLEVIEVDCFKEFWNEILIPNLYNRHDANPVHSLDEITYLKSKFPNKIRQFNVYHENKIVAGSTIFETALVAHSQYISGNEDKNILGSLDFLHFHLLNTVFSKKKYFDFGISNEQKGEKINLGLNYWKQSFGAATHAQFFFELDLKKIEDVKTIFI